MKKLILLSVVIILFSVLIGANVTFFKDQRSDQQYDRAKVSDLIYQLFDLGNNHQIREIRVADLNPLDDNLRFLLVALHRETYTAEDYELFVNKQSYHLVHLNSDYDPGRDADSDEEVRACPDDAVEFVVSSCEDGIPTAVECVNTNYTLLVNKGYKTVKLLGSQENNTNVKNYLSCPNLKAWVRVGHGMTGYLILADGNLNYTYFQGLASDYLNCKVIYANSCQAHNPPFEPAVMGAGAQAFISGNVNLGIGTSEKVCKCWLAAAVNNNAQFCPQVTSCEQSVGYPVGDHGCSQASEQPNNFGTPCGSTAPMADFTYTITGSLTVSFTDKSTDNGTITKWAWNFGNGTTSTLKNPSCIYLSAQTYTVTLTVTDNENETASISKPVFPLPPPPLPCASAGTDFSYFWISKAELGSLNNSSAGSGYSDFSKTVAVTELKKGSNYNVTMTLNTGQYTNWFKAYIDYNRDGDFADDGEVIFVSAAAQKVISDGGPITIPNTAVTGLTTLRLQVMNSTSNNLPAPEPCDTFAYGEVEDYWVNITDDCSTPVANFTFTVNTCNAAFTSTSVEPIVAYSWTFGNGSSSTLANPSCTYAANGNYSVKLTVTNSCGKSASVTKTVAITNCTPNCPYDHLVGSFPNIGIWLRDSQTAAWTQISKQQADIIRLGDVNGNGLDDIAALFKSTGKLWYRYDSGIWEDIPASAATLVAFDLGDMNNDNREDLVGSWSDKGLWWRNSANGVWTKLSAMIPTFVASGDFNGDSKADVVGLFPSLNSIWIYYSNNTWKQISKQINLVDLRAGNMDSDAKAELVGSWDIGVWVFDPETNHWAQHHKKQAKQIAVGDVNAGCMQDIVGYWDAATPLYAKLMESNTWIELSKYNPDTIDAGKVK